MMGKSTEYDTTHINLLKLLPKQLVEKSISSAHLLPKKIKYALR
jgi:hypothetical protein